MQNIDSLTSSYQYDLPLELIAQRPANPRDHSRLLVYREATGEVTHDHFFNLAKYLAPNTRLVFNQSKVFPCRVYGQKPTGGKCELFFLSLQRTEGLYPVMIKARGEKKVGDQYICGEQTYTLEKLHENPGAFWVSGDFDQKNATVPIPPYIRDGVSDKQDLADYQTIYAQKGESVAAPTAGLHFTEAVFESLEEKAIKKSFVTLNVGAGTFKPVKVENISDHEMHEESFEVDEQTLVELNSDPERPIAVGTTSLRTLETLYNGESFERSSEGRTSLFLHPGVEVKSITGLLTNFHLPESTLLMLVSALIGREKTLELYNIAVAEKYRFFSYGDAMLILRKGYE